MTGAALDDAGPTVVGAMLVVSGLAVVSVSVVAIVWLDVVKPFVVGAPLDSAVLVACDKLVVGAALCDAKLPVVRFARIVDNQNSFGTQPLFPMNIHTKRVNHQVICSSSNSIATNTLSTYELVI